MDDDKNMIEVKDQGIGGQVSINNQSVAYQVEKA